jgi:sulfur carrier protein ThiS
MKVRVQVYGTLRQDFPGYQPSEGIDIEIPAGATAKDFLMLVNVSASRGAVVVREGLVLKADEKIVDGDRLTLFQAAHGG